MVEAQADPDNRFIGAVPQLYDRHLGPIFFRPYAQEVAERLKPGERAILETAAGTGVATRTMAAARPDSRIVATDLNQAMLDIAAAAPPARTSSWQQADAQALPFADVVRSRRLLLRRHVHARQARRPTARRGGSCGRAGASCSRSGTESRPNPVQATGSMPRSAELFPDDPPRFFARTPCGYHDRGPDRARASPGGLRTGRGGGGAPRRRGRLDPGRGRGLVPGHAHARPDRGARRVGVAPRHRGRRDGASRTVRRRAVPGAPASLGGGGG